MATKNLQMNAKEAIPLKRTKSRDFSQDIVGSSGRRRYKTKNVAKKKLGESGRIVVKMHDASIK